MQTFLDDGSSSSQKEQPNNYRCNRFGLSVAVRMVCIVYLDDGVSNGL